MCCPFCRWRMTRFPTWKVISDSNCCIRTSVRANTIGSYLQSSIWDWCCNWFNHHSDFYLYSHKYKKCCNMVHLFECIIVEVEVESFYFSSWISCQIRLSNRLLLRTILIMSVNYLPSPHTFKMIIHETVTVNPLP